MSRCRNEREIQRLGDVSLRIDERPVEIEQERMAARERLQWLQCRSALGVSTSFVDDPSPVYSARFQAAAVYAPSSRFSSNERRRDRARCSLERTALSVIESRSAIS